MQEREDGELEEGELDDDEEEDTVAAAAAAAATAAADDDGDDAGEVNDDVDDNNVRSRADDRAIDHPGEQITPTATRLISASLLLLKRNYFCY